MKKKKASADTVPMKDRELIDQMEALEDVLEWLESKDSSDLDSVSGFVQVGENELKEWLKSPKLQRVRRWLDEEKP